MFHLTGNIVDFPENKVDFSDVARKKKLVSLITDINYKVLQLILIYSHYTKKLKRSEKLISMNI